MLSDLIKLIRGIYGEGDIRLHPYKYDQLDERQVCWNALDDRPDCYGKAVGEFEQALAEYTGAKHVICTCSGTAALYAALRIVNIGKNSVMLPNYTFRATANAVFRSGGYLWHVDVDNDTLGMRPKDTRAVEVMLPVYIFGMPYLKTKLFSFFKVIEDAAAALGTFVDGKHAGTFGNAGILSFNGNKILTTGGGGAVLTDDAELANKVRNFITKDFNLRMPALNAALGIPQLERIEETIAKKREVAHTYHDFFDGSEIMCIKEPENCRSNYWLNTLVFPTNPMRDYWFDRLKHAGIECRKGFELLDPNADTPVAKEMCGRILNLPSGVPV
jgi:perosamine synthetase